MVQNPPGDVTHTAVYSVRTIIVACVEMVLLKKSILPSSTRLYGCSSHRNKTKLVAAAFRRWHSDNGI
jgi:hypothetical protein